MKPGEVGVAVGNHLLGFAGLLVISLVWNVGGEILAFIGGAALGACVAGFVYHRRVAEPATSRIKTLGGVSLGGAALVAGIGSQAFLGWMEVPAVNVGIAMVGSLVFPFAIFGQMQKAAEQEAAHNK